ncbi:MAG: GDYXXLXY domain-containing protein [Ignavibacteria bacterium]|nr:GDYXXLXY domain-containing protein [Ignavibacteria bacterium]
MNKGEYLIKYYASNQWSVNIGAQSFFFQEGQAEKYAMAKYGGMKIDKDGNSLLVGLYDEQLRKIE